MLKTLTAAITSDEGSYPGTCGMHITGHAQNVTCRFARLYNLYMFPNVFAGQHLKCVSPSVLAESTSKMKPSNTSWTSH